MSKMRLFVIVTTVCVFVAAVQADAEAEAEARVKFKRPSVPAVPQSPKFNIPNRRKNSNSNKNKSNINVNSHRKQGRQMPRLISVGELRSCEFPNSF